MNILILNSILYTSEKGIIPKVKSIKDCMIYSMGLGFMQAGHNVTLIAAEEYRPIETESYDFEIIFLKSRLKKIFKPTVLPFQSGLYEYLKNNKDKYDIILSSDVFSIQTLEAVLACRKKVAVWQELNKHNRLFFKLPSLFWYNIITRIFYRNACIIPRSEDARIFISRYTKNVSKECIDHGVNLKKFEYSKDKQNCMVVVSQLINRKRIDLIIKEFARFINIKEYADYKLYIIGRGYLENDLKALTTTLKIEKNVCFLNFLPHIELNKYVKSAKALLIYTERDNNMVSISESIVSGTPIVSTSVPAQSNYIKDNMLGIIKDNWTENELVQIVENNSSYVEKCIATRDTLSNQYCAERMISIYKSLTS